MKKFLLLLFVFAGTVTAQVKLPVPRDVQELYNKGTRSADGRPGKNYWQNTADYKIDINYNPVTRLLEGTEEITYINNSPDVLTEMVFKLYPNFYKSDSKRDYPVSAEDLNNGVDIKSLDIDGKGKLRYINIDGTNMTVGNVYIEPGKSATVTVKFSYTLNKVSHLRTGEIETGAAFIAYSFPRIAVYDDLDGWNRNPYLGSAEMYNDFCNFNVSVTVPTNFLVWATGDLQNCNEVLNTKYCERLSNAEKKDDIVFIVDENDLKEGAITKANQFNTWKFDAKNVVDFAFALSDHYVWNSTSVVADKTTGRRTRVDALFNTKHKDYFEVVHDGRKTVNLISNVFPKWPFPYNHISIFDGLDQMEYPMMVNDNPVEDRKSSLTLTEHETFHTIFPFYVGINETKYGWMDEGWATMAEWLLTPMIDSSIADDYGIDRTEAYSGTEQDLPITTLTTHTTGTAFFLNSYPKPAYGYMFVKDMLGDNLFFKGLHFYIQQWKGKHPLPLDFFNCMNTGSGKNLNWFWKKWFYDNGYPDLAITSVSNINSSKKIVIESKGNKPVPVDVTITFNDGSTQKIHRSIAVWEKGNNKVIISFNSNKKIKKVELGSLYVPDTNKADNVWNSLL